MASQPLRNLVIFSKNWISHDFIFCQTQFVNGFPFIWNPINNKKKFLKRFSIVFQFFFLQEKKGENDTSVTEKVKKRHFCQSPPKKGHFCQPKYTSVNWKDTSVYKRTLLSTKRHLCQLFSKNRFQCSCLSQTSLLS